jgi:hypothetical protein
VRVDPGAEPGEVPRQVGVVDLDGQVHGLAPAIQAVPFQWARDPS